MPVIESCSPASMNGGLVRVHHFSWHTKVLDAVDFRHRLSADMKQGCDIFSKQSSCKTRFARNADEDLVQYCMSDSNSCSNIEKNCEGMIWRMPLPFSLTTFQLSITAAVQQYNWSMVRRVHIFWFLAKGTQRILRKAMKPAVTITRSDKQERKQDNFDDPWNFK